MISPSSKEFGNPSLLSRQLQRFAIALFIVFLSSILFSLFPFKPFDPAWRLTFSSVLVDNAAIPLLGLALIHLARFLDPNEPLVVLRRQRVTQLAKLAAIGFLLIVPLQAFSAWRAVSNVDSTSSQQARLTNIRYERVKKAIEQASSNEDIKERLISLKAPAIDASAMALPTPVLKERLLGLLDVQKQERLKLNPAPSKEGLEALLIRSLKVIVAAAAYASAFFIGSKLQGKGQRKPTAATPPS